MSSITDDPPARAAVHVAEAARQGLARWLREVKVRSGDPSYTKLRRRMHAFGVDIPKSTLGDGLTGRRLLSRERAVAVVRACGGDHGLQAECRHRWALARSGTLALAPADHAPTRSAQDPPQAWPLDHDLLRCTVERRGAWQVLRVFGEWDFASMTELRPHLDLALADTVHPHLVIDLSETLFLDSGGLGGLVYALKALRLRGAVLRLVAGVHEPTLTQVGRVLVITGLCAHLPAYASLEEALAPLSALEPPASPASGPARWSGPVPMTADPVASGLPPSAAGTRPNASAQTRTNADSRPPGRRRPPWNG